MTTVQLNKTLDTVYSLLLHGPPRRDSSAAAGAEVWPQSGVSYALLARLRLQLRSEKKNIAICKPLQTGPVTSLPSCHVG